MPDLIDQHLRDAFAELHADESTRLRPPGTATARRTVRRRRIITTTAAGVVLLAVPGGLAVHGLAPSDGRGGPPAARAVSPTLPAAELDQLAERARAVVGEEQGDVAAAAHHAGVVAFAGLTLDAVPGTYTLRVACGGRGSIEVSVTADPIRTSDDDSPTELRTATVPCPSPARSVQVPVRVPRTSGTIAIDVRGDEQAQGRSGFAVALALSQADRLHLGEVAAAAITGESESQVAAAHGPLTAGGSLDLMDILDPGRYVLRVACAGRGALTAEVEASPTGERADPEHRVTGGRVPCADRPRVVELPFTKSGSGSLGIAVDPDETASGLASVGYALFRA